MANTGVGMQPAGSTSAGYGVAPTATGLGGAFLRDIRTGEVQFARYVNPTTRDYELDENGRMLGMGYVRQCVQLSVHTELGSCVVQAMGQRLRSLKRITSGFERLFLYVLSDAVQPLIEQGLIEVVGFTAYRAGDNTNGLMRGAVYGRFLWRDLTTGQEHEERI
jgi:hypothetical protein